MADDRGRRVLITGANVGIGKEVARQLALRGDTARVYLACRNEDKARAARAELQATTGRAVFEILRLDTTDLASVRAAVAALAEPLDALVMNAGGSGGPTPRALTRDGATHLFAANVLGHVVLCEELIEQDKLRTVGVLAGSEAARGIPKFRMARPVFTTSSVQEFTTVVDGSFFDHTAFSTALAYGQAKYLGALWMASLARKHPELRLITISPGNTSGTDGPKDLPLPLRFVATYVLPVIGPALGLAHDLQTGARRLVDGLSDPSLRSGVFYASAADAITGPIVDQATLMAALTDPTIQDHADEAIHRFIS